MRLSLAENVVLGEGCSVYASLMRPRQLEASRSGETDPTTVQRAPPRLPYREGLLRFAGWRPRQGSTLPLSFESWCSLRSSDAVDLAPIIAEVRALGQPLAQVLADLPDRLHIREVRNIRKELLSVGSCRILKILHGTEGE